jgi:hypothetical protein
VSATASACPRAKWAMGSLREPCRGGSNGNQVKMAKGQNHHTNYQKQPKPPKLPKSTKTWWKSKGMVRDTFGEPWWI